MIAVVIMVLLFVALGASAMRWGADSRDGRDWQPGQTPPLDWPCGAPYSS